MKNKEIKSLSVKENRLRCNYEQYDSATGDVSTLTYENLSAIHPDLQKAMQRLAFHVGCITGMAPGEGLTVQSYRKQGAGNSWLITFYSHIIPPGGDEQRSNLATRIYVGQDSYEWTELLMKDLERCEEEALAYMEKGKRFENDTFIRIDSNDPAGKGDAA